MPLHRSRFILEDLAAKKNILKEKNLKRYANVMLQAK